MDAYHVVYVVIREQAVVVGAGVVLERTCDLVEVVHHVVVQVAVAEEGADDEPRVLIASLTVTYFDPSSEASSAVEREQEPHGDIVDIQLRVHDFAQARDHTWVRGQKAEGEGAPERGCAQGSGG